MPLDHSLHIHFSTGLLILFVFLNCVSSHSLQQEHTNALLDSHNKSSIVQSSIGSSGNNGYKHRASASTTTHNLHVNRFEYRNFIAENYIWPIFPIFFLVIGTISNILSIVVFTRREMRKFSSFCYFAFLNAINLAVLYITLIRVIMEFNFETDVRKLSIFTCKLHVFLTYMLGHLSSLLLCTISIDRVISVLFLHRSKQFCTPRVALRATLGLILFNFLLSSHILVFESAHKVHHYTLLVNNQNRTILMLDKHEPNSTLFYERSEIVCDSVSGTWYYDMLQDVWKIIDASIFAFIPFFIMLICSVIIIGRVAQQSKKFKKKSKSSSAMKKSQVNAQSTSGANCSSQQNSNMSSRTRNLALMLIPVNILFLMFLSPVVLTMYLYEDLSQDRLTLAIVELLSYCNFTFNFVIYFLTSSKFREEFYKFINEAYMHLTKSNRQLIATNTFNKNNNATVANENRKSIAANLNQNKNGKNDHEAIALINKITDQS